MANPQPVFLRTPYNYDRDQASDDAGLACRDPSLAQQQFKDDSDINVIVERFGLTGHLPANGLEPFFGDFSDVTDFHTAMQAVRRSAEAFLAFPAEIRSRFANDPQNLMDFLDNPANRSEAENLGLVKKGNPTPVTRPPEPDQPAK